MSSMKGFERCRCLCRYISILFAVLSCTYVKKKRRRKGSICRSGQCSEDFNDGECMGTCTNNNINNNNNNNNDNNDINDDINNNNNNTSSCLLPWLYYYYLTIDYST